MATGKSTATKQTNQRNTLLKMCTAGQGERCQSQGRETLAGR
jgi:hypothetical protein